MTTWQTVYSTLFGKALTQDEVDTWESMAAEDLGPKPGADIIIAMRSMPRGKFAPTYPEVRRAVENLRSSRRAISTGACTRCRKGWMYFAATRDPGTLRIIGFTISDDPSFNNTAIECLCDTGKRLFEHRTEIGDWWSGKTPEVTRFRERVYDAIGKEVSR